MTVATEQQSARACPECGGRSKVVDTYDAVNGTTCRKRLCRDCKHTWKTTERTSAESPETPR